MDLISNMNFPIIKSRIFKLNKDDKLRTAESESLFTGITNSSPPLHQLNIPDTSEPVFNRSDWEEYIKNNIKEDQFTDNEFPDNLNSVFGKLSLLKIDHVE